MFVLIVHVHVKPECIDAFREATIDNASNSVREPGIARFDVIQQSDDPTRFMLIEVYREADAHNLHKETAHYKRWCEKVDGMMAEPRKGIRFEPVFPGVGGW